jgi:hypothetical protein
MITFWVDVYVPSAGLNVGVATVPLGVIVYVALAVELGVQPSLKALVFIVVVLLTLSGLLYAVELDVGSLPLVV